MSRRQQRPDRTADAILATAYRLYERQGYDETTVDEIAAASDISPRTFYRYFPSKDMTLAINGFHSVDRVLEHVPPDAPPANSFAAWLKPSRRPWAARTWTSPLGYSASTQG